MRYDIYYILEHWAPSLTKNKIYQELIKDIISAKETFRVKDIDNENRYIELNPAEYQKIIRVDVIEQDFEKNEEEQKKKIEYSCFIDKDSSTYTATFAISEDESTDLVCSYIEIDGLENYNYLYTTTVTISKTKDNKYSLKHLQAEKCIYDNETIGLFFLNTDLRNLSNINNYTNYTKELRRIITGERKKDYIIPDLQLSMDIEIDPENENYYKISYDGHNDFPTKQTQEEITPLNDLSLDAIIGRINHHYLFNDGELPKAWKEKAQKIISGSTSDNIAEIVMTAPSYGTDEFIEKVSPETKIVKQKNRKDG